MRVMRFLSSLSTVILTLGFLTVLPHCQSHRIEEIFEKCPENITVSPVGEKGRKYIINGTEEDIKKFPFTVQLHLVRNNFFVCGGVIISKYFVISAGHCIYKPKDNFYISVVSSNIYNGERYDIAQAVHHPEYKYPRADFVLLRTSREIRFTESVKAVKMPRLREEAVPGTMAHVLGWGLVSQNPPVNPPVLMRVDLPILSHENCNRAYTGVTKYTLCAGYKEGMKSGCRGDSGGPLVIKGTLFGIVSGGPRRCDRPNCPSLFAKVSEVIEWIRSITAKQI